MALVPAVTDITSRVATWDASGIIDAVRDHIFNDTTHLQIDDYNTGEGLTIGFLAAGEGHQVNLRKNAAAIIKMSIEPSGSITDAGDSTPTAPTGTSADWSDERLGWDVTLGTPATGSKVWVVELSDAFFVWVTNSTNAFHVTACHAGRIATSFASSDAAAQGNDGLGIISGIPDPAVGSGNDWVGTTSPASTVHWQTNEWSDHVSLIALSGSTHVASVAHTSYRPLPPQTLIAVDIGGTTSDQAYGPFKYMRFGKLSELPKTLVVDSGSAQGFMHFNDTAAAGSDNAIWDKTKTP